MNYLMGKVKKHFLIPVQTKELFLMDNFTVKVFTKLRIKNMRECGLKMK